MHRSPFGSNDSSISIQITQTIEQIDLLDRQIDDDEAKIEQIVNAMGSVIMTIPGIRYVEAGIILGEIGDIHRFPDYHKLLAYSGLYPVIRQSGKFNASHTRMSKRGSRTLRYALVYLDLISHAFLHGDPGDPCFRRIDAGFHRKTEAMERHELYTIYKTGASPEIRNQAREDYLEAIGLRDAYHWSADHDVNITRVLDVML